MEIQYTFFKGTEIQHSKVEHEIPRISYKIPGRTSHTPEKNMLVAKLEL